MNEPAAAPRREGRERPAWAVPAAIAGIVVLGLLLAILFLLLGVDRQLEGLAETERRLAETGQEIALLAEEQAATTEALRAAVEMDVATRQLVEDLNTQVTAVAEQVDRNQALLEAVREDLRQLDRAANDVGPLLQRLDRRLAAANERLAASAQQLGQATALLRETREEALKAKAATPKVLTSLRQAERHLRGTNERLAEIEAGLQGLREDLRPPEPEPPEQPE